MIDKELLELAAKAAWGGFAQQMIDGGWNPLDDDGDALRLAVKLCMSISTGPVIAKSNTISGALRGEFPEESTIGYLDQYAATRRAIVRSAAEIGKGMK